MQIGQNSAPFFIFPPAPASASPFILEDGTKNPLSTQLVDFIPIDENNSDFIAQGSNFIKSTNFNKSIQFLNDIPNLAQELLIQNETNKISFYDSATSEQLQLQIDNSNAYFQLYHNKSGTSSEIQLGASDGASYNDIIIDFSGIVLYKKIKFTDAINEIFEFENGLFKTILKSENITQNVNLYFPNKNGTLAISEFTEAFGGAIVNTIINTWQVVVLTGAPINSIVDVLVTNASAGVSYNAGVRKVGSTLARIVSTTGSNNCCITVKTNASGQIEIYSGNLANITFRHIGTHGQ